MKKTSGNEYRASASKGRSLVQNDNCEVFEGGNIIYAKNHIIMMKKQKRNTPNLTEKLGEVKKQNKYSPIEALIDDYQSRMEEIFGVKIGKINVFSFSEYPSDCVKAYQRRFFQMLPAQKEQEIKKRAESSLEKFCMLTIPGNTNIYVDDNILAEVAKENFYKKAIGHELGHFVFDILLKNNMVDEQVRRIFSEGFAEYVSFDLPQLYKDQNIMDCLNRVKQELEQKDDPKLVPYKKGYKFVTYVIGEIGLENLNRVFTNPPLNMKEIENPETYLKRLQSGTKPGNLCLMANGVGVMGLTAEEYMRNLPPPPGQRVRNFFKKLGRRKKEQNGAT